jgi:hypothetical protein
MKALQINADLFPVAALETLPGWQELDAASKKTVHSETAQLGAAVDVMVRSRIAMGEHFTRIHGVLEPKRLWSKFCEVYNLNRSTINASVAAYTKVNKVLPVEVLRVAASRGVDMMGAGKDLRPLGKYTDAVKRLPPPKTADTTQIVKWLDDVETLRKKQKKRAAEVEPDANDLLKEAYRFLVIRLDKVPSRRRRAWLGQLVGMGMTKIGLSSPQTFEPEAPPQSFVAVVGRPAGEAAA